MVEKNLELILILVLQTLLEPDDGVLVGKVAVHEAAPARLLHDLAKGRKSMSNELACFIGQ